MKTSYSNTQNLFAFSSAYKAGGHLKWCASISEKKSVTQNVRKPPQNFNKWKHECELHTDKYKSEQV